MGLYDQNMLEKQHRITVQFGEDGSIFAKHLIVLVRTWLVGLLQSSEIANLGVLTKITQPAVTPRRKFLEQNGLRLLSNRVLDNKFSYPIESHYFKCLFPTFG